MKRRTHFPQASKLQLIESRFEPFLNDTLCIMFAFHGMWLFITSETLIVTTAFFKPNFAIAIFNSHNRQIYSSVCTFNIMHQLDAYHISLCLNNIIPHISASSDAWAINHPSEMCHFYSHCQPLACNYLPPHLLLLSLISFIKDPGFYNPACLYGIVTFWHECPGNPPPSPLQIHANHNI